MWVYSCLLPKASNCKLVYKISIRNLKTVLLLILRHLDIEASMLHLNRIEIVIELLQLAFTTISIRVNTSN